MAKKSNKAAKKAAPQIDLTASIAIALLSMLQDLSDAGAETLDDAIALVSEHVPEPDLDEDEDEDLEDEEDESDEDEDEDEDDFDDEDDE